MACKFVVVMGTTDGYPHVFGPFEFAIDAADFNASTNFMGEILPLWTEDHYSNPYWSPTP